MLIAFVYLYQQAGSFLLEDLYKQFICNRTIVDIPSIFPRLCY
jgi:hypothetical protein